MESGKKEQERIKHRQPEPVNEKIADASKTIFSYCMAKTPNRMEAEDLCQDILCELLRSSGSLRDSRAFYGFMWAVAGNVYKQWCRKKAGQQTCELTEDIPSEESVPDRVLGGEDEDLYLLRRELALLSEKYRRTLILYYIDGKSCSEIAGCLSISESRVKYLLFKSRKILKEGMSMERRLGELSYNPKTFLSMYNGTGPNRFWDFMQSRIRQNIVEACYNDRLTREQISLETGIPLPYLDSEISALAEKEILLQEGPRYKANIIILTTECADEILQSAAPYHEKAAGLMAEFLETNLPAFRQIGFLGADFSDNTLRWQLMTFLLREIRQFGAQKDDGNGRPLTAWGDRAYLWLEEQGNAFGSQTFDFCTKESRRGDRIYFADYMPAPRGSQLDFSGNDYPVNLLCDIAHGEMKGYSEYDLEAVAELIKKGYVLKEKDAYKVAMPLFTKAQHAAASGLAKAYVGERLGKVLTELDRIAVRILSEHTPGHLQRQVPGIASMGKSVNAGYIPVRILTERKILCTDWNPLEMPTMQIRLNISTSDEV